MLPPELVKQIRMLEIRTDRAVDEIVCGAYRSVFKGRGIEFDEVREYVPGDDVRTIDWNVTARIGAPFVKKFVEERELVVMLVVDLSASGDFGAAKKSKREAAAELAALLAFSAGRSGDKVGLYMFTDRCELYVPPRSGRRHALRIVREVLAFEPEGRGTDIGRALREVAMLMKKRGIVFLIGDLLDEHDFGNELKLLNRRHDVVALELYDPAERAWASRLGACVEDAESGEIIDFSGGGRAHDILECRMQWCVNVRRELCRRARVDLVEIASDGEVLPPLINFFARRSRRRR